MKKLIGTVAALLLVAGAAFAELSIGGGATAIFAPVASNGEDLKTGMTQPWGGSRSSSVSFTWVSDDGKAGSTFCMVNAADASSHDLDGATTIWVKPIDKLTLTFGRWKITKITRGFVATPSWGWLRPNTWVVGDDLVPDMQANGAGATVELEPIENLYVMAGLSMGGAMNDAYELFENAKVAVAYTIDGIGMIQARWEASNPEAKPDTSKADKEAVYITKSGTDAGEKGWIEAAFTLTAVENLTVDVGGAFHLYDKDYIKVVTTANGTTGAVVDAKNDITKVKVGLAATYKVTDEFSVGVDFSMATYEVKDPALSFGVGLTYGISDQLSAAADFRALIPTTDGIDPSFSFLVGLDYACSSNGSIGIGFQGTICGKDNYPAMAGVLDADATKAKAGDSVFMWAVPVKMSVGF